jgi:hypothetical protein
LLLGLLAAEAAIINSLGGSNRGEFLSFDRRLSSIEGIEVLEKS